MKSYMDMVFMRIEKLQSLLRQSTQLDGALIVSPENRRYFTGFPSSDGYLLVSADRAVFVTDSRYFEAACQKAAGCEIVLQSTDRGQLKALFSEMGVRRIGIEASRMSLSAFARCTEMLAPLELSADNTLDLLIHALRAVKTADEVERIECAQRIAEQAFAHICNFIEPGKTEREVALELDFFMLSHGAEALSFETIAVSGANSSKPHGVPGDKKIEPGDFVTMDFGAVVDGYHSDMTRTVAVGKVSEKQKEVYAVVLEAQTEAVKVLKAGLPCCEADAAARGVIDRAGYGACFGHSTGHGVGIEIHERPNLAPRAKDALVTGNVVTVEPGIYLPGEFGVRTEDMAFITAEGCRNLTNCPKELLVL